MMEMIISAEEMLTAGERLYKCGWIRDDDLRNGPLTLPVSCIKALACAEEPSEALLRRWRQDYQ